MSKTRTEAFRDWLDTTTPGQVFIYYTGSLADDRGVYVYYGDSDVPVYEPNGDIDALGNLAYEAFLAGRVHLFQRKIHDKEYQYIAMKRYMAGRLW